MKSALKKGFTLVELLIVIALLGVIATIVIAAINPIEQANRATDAGLKADASQLVSAIERYYASHESFPWNDCTGVNCTPIVATPEAPINFVPADTVGYGLCVQSGLACRTQDVHGQLIEALELQSAFLNKKWVGETAPDNLLIAKGDTASSSVYACWVPKSNSNRQKLISAGKVLTTTLAGEVPEVTNVCPAVDSDGWKTGACIECVPE